MEQFPCPGPWVDTPAAIAASRLIVHVKYLSKLKEYSTANIMPAFL